ncbi:MAG: hypothetical protein GXO55_10095 [Chloroflexi bacterium]|nr:hypothetical protein [Chloroflexota bacterium]
MQRTRVSILLAVIPGLIILVSTLYPMYTRHLLLLASAWVLGVLVVAWRRGRVPEWGIPAVAWVYVALIAMPLWLGHVLERKGVGGDVVVGLVGIGPFVLLGLALAAWGVHIRHVWSHRRGRRVLVIALGLGVLGGLLQSVASLWLPARPGTPAFQQLDVMVFLTSLLLEMGLAGLLLAALGLTRRWTSPRSSSALMLIGVLGYFLWAFWLEFDYGLVGSGYPRLMNLWFAFWLTLVLPAAALLPIGRRHPVGVLTIVLLSAFMGTAVLEAVTRVSPSALDGLLAFLHVSRPAESVAVPGAGSWAYAPLWRVLLFFVFQHVGMALTGLIAFLLTSGGLSPHEARATAETSEVSIPRLPRRGLLFSGLLLTTLILLAGCVPATPTPGSAIPATVDTPATPAALATSPTPTTLPGTVTVKGTVTDVTLSAKVILLETENGPVDVALTDRTRVLGPDGHPIELRDIRPGYVIRATGRPGTEKSVIPVEVRVLEAAGKPTPPPDVPQTMPPTPGPVPMTATMWQHLTLDDLGVSLDVPANWRVERRPGMYIIGPDAAPWLVVGVQEMPTDLEDLFDAAVKRARDSGESDAVGELVQAGAFQGVAVWGQRSVCVDVYVPVEDRVIKLTFMPEFCTDEGTLNSVGDHILDTLAPTSPTSEARGAGGFVLVGRTDGSVWQVPLTGGEATQVLPPVADPQGDGYRWALSPDRRWLAYVVFRRWREEEASGSLHLRSLETGKDRVVVSHLLPEDTPWQQMPSDADRAVLVENWPVWDHGSTAFLFLSGHEGRANLYVYDVQGEEVVALASPPHNAAWPEWSPDDAWILYHDVEAFGTGAGPTGGALWGLPADRTSSPRRLTPDDDHFEFVTGWANPHTALTHYISLMGPSHFAAVDVATGKRTPADVVSSMCQPRRGVPVRSSSRPDRVMYLVDPLNGCADRWEWSEPVQVEDGLGYVGRFLNFQVEKTCYVYERGVGIQVKPLRWCDGIMSPDGRYLVRAGQGGLVVTDLDKGTTRMFDTTGERVRLRWVGPDHTLLVAQPMPTGLALYRLQPETGEWVFLLDKVSLLNRIMP